MDAKSDFREKGFAILGGVYPLKKIEELHQSILMDIQKCADELNCSVENYLTSVSRWAHPSPVTEKIHGLAETSLQKIACSLIGEPVKLSKMNVISKSAYAAGPVPCHQDIAYSRDDPYEFSLWLPLQNVFSGDGELEFLPNSHLDAVEPAVDFWQPDFVDKMHSSMHWRKNFVSTPVRAGDAIAFDARIWHRSAQNASGRNRFAIVSRWIRLNNSLFCEVPEKIPAPFGMWTCGHLTERILRQGLFHCFQFDVTSNLTSYIDLWQERLNGRERLPFSVNLSLAVKSLNHLSILHRSAQLHNGGDAQGVVYPNLWHDFLHPLSQWLAQFESRR